MDLYTVEDLHRITGLSKCYIYGKAHRIVGYQPLKEATKPGRNRIIRFRKPDIDFALSTGKPLIREE